MSNYTKKSIELPLQPILFKASSQLTDIENRIVTVIASNETPVERFSWERWEEYELILSHEDSAVDLTRVKNGVCLFFDGHPGSFFSDSKRIGKVIKAKLENKELICTIKLNRSTEADRYLQDVEDGTEPGNSVGVQIKKMQLVSKAKYEDSDDDENEDRPRRKIKQLAKYKATSWQIHELSSVSIPAIPSTGRKLSAEEQEKFNQLPRYTVEVEGDEESLEIFASSDGLKVGDFASWNASGGKSQGKVTQVERNDKITVPGATVEGTEDDPVAKLTVYDKVRDGYEASDTEVAHKFSTLTKISPLKKPTKEEKNMADQDKQDRLQELADENRELKVQLSQANKDLEQSKVEFSKVTLQNQYWQLRTQAISLYALENKLTEEEFKLDFSDDPGIDLQRLADFDVEDAKIELRTIDRALRRASLKSPVDRLKTDKEKGVVTNSKIQSKPDDPTKTSEEFTDDEDVDEFLKSFKPRQIK